MSAVKELVDQTMEDNGMSLADAVESVASTLDLEAGQVMQEYVEASEDEERDLEPPDDF